MYVAREVDRRQSSSRALGEARRFFMTGFSPGAGSKTGNYAGLSRTSARCEYSRRGGAVFSPTATGKAPKVAVV